MVRRILSLCAIALLMLLLGARLDNWQAEGVSLVGDGAGAIYFGGADVYE